MVRKLAVMAVLLGLLGSVSCTGTGREGAQLADRSEHAPVYTIPGEFSYLYPQLEKGPYTLHGTVTCPDGLPAKGVRVAAFRGEMWEQGYVETATAEDGSYEFRNLPDGAYLLIAVGDDATNARTISLHDIWMTGNKLRQDLKTEPVDAEVATGRVLDSQGEPVEGALVLSVADWGSYGISLALQTRTDREGGYTIHQSNTPLMDMRPPFVAFAEGHGPGVLRGALSTTEANDIVLEDGVRVSGTVRFKDSGKPAPGIAVTLRGTAADDNLPDITTKTDATGSFVFGRLCPFQYQLVVYNPEERYTALEHPTLRLFDRQNVEGLDVLISEGATVSGTVTVRETGEPLAGVRVWIPNVRPPRVIREALTDSDGKYSLRYLPAGGMTVRCEVPENVVREPEPPPWGGEPSLSPTEKGVSLGPEEQAAGVDFTFERGASVSGRVMDQAGNPVAGARLNASSGGGGHLISTSEAQTDKDGTYCLSGFRVSSQYRMTVRAEGHGRLVEPFLVTGKTLRKDFILETAATISGRVVDTNGQRVPCIQVSLKPLDETFSRALPQGAVSDEEGRFTFQQGAYPGTYYFELYTLNMGFGPYKTLRAKNDPIRIADAEDLRGIEVICPDDSDPGQTADADSGAGVQ